MRSTTKLATRLFLSLLIGAAAACEADGGSTAPEPGPGPAPAPAPAPADVSGSYSLTQVRTLGNLGGGGSGLPADFVDGSGDHLVFQSGALTLGSDGAFDLKVQVTFRGNASELTDYGTYSVSDGGVIDFDSQKSTPRLSNGAVSGNKITANSQFGGIPFEIDVQR
jgi:hypothetical protein